MAGDRDAVVAVLDEVQAADPEDLDRRHPLAAALGLVDPLPARPDPGAARPEVAVELRRRGRPSRRSCRARIVCSPIRRSPVRPSASTTSSKRQQRADVAGLAAQPRASRASAARRRDAVEVALRVLAGEAGVHVPAWVVEGRARLHSAATMRQASAGAKHEAESLRDQRVRRRLALLAVPGRALRAPPSRTTTSPPRPGPLTAGQTSQGEPRGRDRRRLPVLLPARHHQRVRHHVQLDAEARRTPPDRGRTIVSSLLRARKGKLPLPVADTARTLKPKEKATVKVTLLPGKYFIPIGRAVAERRAAPRRPVPASGSRPVGSTTDSFEIFEQPLPGRQALRSTGSRSSIKRTGERIKKAKKNDAPTGKIVKLKIKLQEQARQGEGRQEGREVRLLDPALSDRPGH